MLNAPSADALKNQWHIHVIYLNALHWMISESVYFMSYGIWLTPFMEHLNNYVSQISRHGTTSNGFSPVTAVSDKYMYVY